MNMFKSNGSEPRVTLPPTAIIPIPPRPPQTPMPPKLNPKSFEAAAAYSDMWDALESAQAENAQLRADVALERRHVADLTRLLAVQTERTECYQRYAVRTMTHLETICTAAKRAHDEGMKFSEERAPPPPPRPTPDVERDAARLEAALAEAMQRSDPHDEMGVGK
jgi:hypothetical protein